MENFSKTAKQAISLIIILILIAVAAYFGHRSGLSKGMALAAEKEARIAALNEQITDLNSKIEKVNKAFPPIPELKTLIGTVEEVKGNIIIFNVPPLINPFEQMPVKREAAVTAATKLVRQSKKDAETVRRENEEYNKKIQEMQKTGNYTSIQSPMPYDEFPIKLAEIKAGDLVSVEAANNVKSQVKFEAVKVALLERN